MTNNVKRKTYRDDGNNISFNSLSLFTINTLFTVLDT